MTAVPVPEVRPVARRGLLSPGRARWLAWSVIGAGAILHLVFLLSAGAPDLTGDEAYYWDWSRQLDYGYFSKPAMIAWIIRGSCAVLGDNAFAVRLPAVLLAALSQWLAWFLTWRLFRSERLALGVVGLFCCVPLLMAGSVLMTIDAPLFFLLALASTLAALALFEHRPKLLLGAGVALALAACTKHSALLWGIGLFAFLGSGQKQRRWLRTPWPWAMVGIGLLGYVPAVIWNLQHGWVTALHISGDVAGQEGPRFGVVHVIEFLAGQLGLASPPMAALMVAGVGLALQGKGQDGVRVKLRFLACTALPLWLLPAMVGFWNKVQGNWTAPAYFGLTILAGYFASTVIGDELKWKKWGAVVWAAGLVGAFTIVLTHHSHLIYHGTAMVNRMCGTRLNPQKIDPVRRARGWGELGEHLGRHLAGAPEGTLVMAADYQGTALSAFYTPGQPVTHRFGASLNVPDRLSQYELWEDRRLDRPELLGREAIIVANRPECPLADYFDSLEPLETITVKVAGIEARTIYLFRCKGFKGMKLNRASRG